MCLISVQRRGGGRFMHSKEVREGDALKPVPWFAAV